MSCFCFSGKRALVGGPFQLMCHISIGFIVRAQLQHLYGADANTHAFQQRQVTLAPWLQSLWCLAVCRVPTKIGKQNSMTFPWLICFFPWLPFSHGFRCGYDCVSQHAQQSQTTKLPQPWEEAIPWLCHDFLGNFHIPWLSMTRIFSRIFHDRGNPEYGSHGGTLAHTWPTDLPGNTKPYCVCDITISAHITPIRTQECWWHRQKHMYQQQNCVISGSVKFHASLSWQLGHAWKWGKCSTPCLPGGTIIPQSEIQTEISLFIPFISNIKHHKIPASSLLTNLWLSYCRRYSTAF